MTRIADRFRSGLFVVACGLLAAGCVATELRVDKSDPSSPKAVAPAPATSPGVLAAGFDPLAARTAKAAAASRYTCPMHPEIVRSEPGKCPKCGMDLVPMHGGSASKTPAGDSDAGASDSEGHEH